MLNVTDSAKPSDLKRLAVIVMVPISLNTAATFTRLLFGIRLSCCDSSKNPQPIGAIAVITHSHIAFDSLGVAVIESGVESLESIPPRLGQIATAF